MVCNSQVPSGASEKDWAHISNFPISDNSALCNPTSLLTVSLLPKPQTKEQGSHCPYYIFSSQG